MNADLGPGVAVVGCGWAGTRHAAALQAAGAPVRWLIDRDPRRAAALAQRHPSARAGADLRAALADDRVAAVAVCLPHAAHAAAGLAALRAGRHVLCEKPLAPSLAEADALIAAAERAGRVLAVVDNSRHDPVFERVGAHLRAGTVGAPALARMHREADLRAAFLADRRGFLEPGGGILLSGAVHDVGRLRALLGEITEVRAMAAPARIPEMADEDTAVVLLRFANGPVGVLVESFASRRHETAGQREVHTLRIDASDGFVEIAADRTVRVHGPAGDSAERVPAVDTFAAVAGSFLALVRAGSPLTAQARDHRRTLSVALAARDALVEPRPA